ncbi:MAG: hypothetical protein LBF93_02340 [Zoogloeaceae bacterium]|jgi:hypothetical protein|nr:hypothetical protein [Zoogloeaceae bacterium]
MSAMETPEEIWRDKDKIPMIFISNLFACLSSLFVIAFILLPMALCRGIRALMTWVRGNEMV